jgi:hypothetical protein
VNRTVEAGCLARAAAGRTGRRTSSPPQLGQAPANLVSAQSAQKVHSKVHILAFGLAGGRSQSQHSQLGRSSSILVSIARVDRAGPAP